MGYNVVDIQGIGPVYAEKLVAAGIATVEQLLEKGKTFSGSVGLCRTVNPSPWLYDMP